MMQFLPNAPKVEALTNLGYIMTEIETGPRMLVDIVSDPVCPWCFVGLQGFLRARDLLKDELIVLPRLRA